MVPTLQMRKLRLRGESSPPPALEGTRSLRFRMEKVKRASLASPLTHNSRALPESLFPSVKWAQLCPRCSHCRVTSSELRMTDEHCSLSPRPPSPAVPRPTPLPVQLHLTVRPPPGQGLVFGPRPKGQGLAPGAPGQEAASLGPDPHLKLIRGVRSEGLQEDPLLVLLEGQQGGLLGQRQDCQRKGAPLPPSPPAAGLTRRRSKAENPSFLPSVTLSPPPPPRPPQRRPDDPVAAAQTPRSS